MATRLLDSVEAAVSGVRRVLTAERDFDPTCSEREFRVAMSDHTVAVLGSALSTLLDELAPNVRLRIEQLNTGHVSSPLHTLRTIDAVVLPYGYVRDLPRLDLCTDEWVCLVSADNRAVGEHVTIEQLSELPWVVSYDSPSSPAVQQRRFQGIEPRTRIVVDSFTALPYLIAGTNRIALVYRGFADQLPTGAGVRTVSCPFNAHPSLETVWWHPMYEADAGRRWLRTVFAQAAQTIDKRPRARPHVNTRLNGERP
ncbi:LysR substrate-binding domain-containing protein [Streptomyces sp. B21-108]|uniref:LysR substrate-binding domain-containing protein n=1 Tax=Streptomyces sp. B21-108 TaxID=3039419 RepID=UPI002FF35D1C